jgi:valyl-tRNA synthetase
MFVNPEDKRFKHLIGTHAITPLFGIKVPILADERVDIEKGTGAVMCCTFGDITDVYWWKKYNLNTKMIIAQYGKILELENILPFKDSINSEKAKEYASQIENLKIDDARKKIIEILKDEGLLIKQEEITHPVKCGERSKAPIEILISNQWFIKVLDKKQALIEKANECVWYPSYMKTRLEIWVNGLSFDWCISRQRFFGVPFPIWYSKRKGEEGKVLTPSLEDLPVDPLVDLPRGYTREEVEADKDVMDTWATSSISPQLNSHAITKEFAIDYERHKQLYPADLRPQAHEIIRTWTFSTIVKSLIHENSIPWKNLMISGWCLAADKTKMSKSKGNIVTPTGLIEEKGADTIRYWTATSKLGSDIAYSEDVFANGKRLINKLWNAASFAAIHLANIKGAPETVTKDIEKKIIFEEMDKWALLKLREAIERATAEFEEYEYSIARQAIENFFWKDFCDNYLEIAKARAYNEDGKNAAGQQSAIYTIHHIIKTLLLLFAPFMPHITEEISNILWEGESIHKIGTWPKLENFSIGNFSDESGEAFIIILDMVRKLKADRQVSIRAPIANLQIASGSQNATLLAGSLNDFASVVNAEKISISNNNSGYLEAEGGKLYLKVDFA